MAIIINNKNLYRRVINGQDVQKVVLNGKEIRPTGGNIDYHVVSNWGTGSGGGGTGVPGGWDVSGSTSMSERYVSNDDSGSPAKLSYDGMPSLLNAFKVEIIYRLYRTQESTEKPFSSGLTRGTSNTYLSEITQSSGWERSFLAGNESDNDVLTGATAGEYTITTILDLENSSATQTIAGPNDFEQELELTLDATDIYNIRHSDAFGIELNDGMRLYRVDFFVYNTPQNPQVGPGIYHNEDLGLISLSSDGVNRMTIADKNLGAGRIQSDGLIYQWGNNHGFPNQGAINTSTTKVDVSQYGPGNYYNSDTFVIGDSYWTTTNNTNLWGGDTDEASSQQGPCPGGFHIPTQADINMLIGILGSRTEEYDITEVLLFPRYGSIGRSYSTGNPVYPNDSEVRGCTSVSNRQYRAYILRLDAESYNIEYTSISNGCQIRPFKNEHVAPDSTRTVLFQPSD